MGVRENVYVFVLCVYVIGKNLIWVSNVCVFMT